MKKYLLSGFAAALMLFSASSAFAYDFQSPYVLAEGGYSLGTESNGDAGILGVGMGYHINNYFRTDLTVGYRGWGNVDMKADRSKRTDVWSIPVLANFYLSYPLPHNFNVYGMAGLGMAWNKTDDMRDAKGATKSNFAWTVGAGIEHMFTDCMSLDLGYRYVDLGQARVKSKAGYTGRSKEDMRAHDIKLTARFYF